MAGEEDGGDWTDARGEVRIRVTPGKCHLDMRPPPTPNQAWLDGEVLATKDVELAEGGSATVEMAPAPK